MAERIVIGVLADAGTPVEVAEWLADELPPALTKQIDSDVDWQIRVREEPMPLDEHGHIPMLQLAQTHKSAHEWDLLVLLTDLPRRTGTRPIISDYSTTHGARLISVPALGAIALRRRAHRLFVHLVCHLLVERLGLTEPGRLGGLLLPAEHIEAEDTGIDQHLTLVGVRGRLRLLAGMVRDNRPWRLVPNLSSATAAAAATAAYGVVTSTFWTMADALSPWRLMLITVLAVAAMTSWLLVYNHLWEAPRDRQERGKVMLYNTSTLVTLLLGVTCMYAILYLLTLIAAGVVIDSGYLAARLGHPAGWPDYATVAWLAASVGIVAGALGSSLEDEAAVRRATYSQRERQRQARNRRATE